MPERTSRPSRGSIESIVRMGSAEPMRIARPSARIVEAIVDHHPRHIEQPGAPSKTSFTGPIVSGPSSTPVVGPSSASHGSSR